MQRFPQFFFVVLFSLGMSACSSLAVQDRPADAAAPQAMVSTDGAPPVLPGHELSGQLLYQILEAEIALQRQHFDVAISRFLQLAETTRDPRFAERAAQISAFVREDPALLTAASLWVEIDPGNNDAHQMMVVAAIRNARLDTALEHMEIVLSDADGPLEERFELMAGLLSREHDLEEALRLMEHFVSTRQDDPDALFAYGNLALRAGDLERASDAVERALDLRPGWYGAILMQVRVLQMQNQPEEALDFLAGAVEQHPADTRLRMTYARLLMDMRRYEEAIEQYESLAVEVSPNTEILFTLAMIHLQLERFDEAEAYFLQVRDAGDHAGDLNYFFGWIEEKRGNDREAISFYTRVPSADESHFEARIRLAILIAAQGDLAASRQQLHDLRLQQPVRQKRLYQIEGELLRQAGRHDTGLDVLTIALEQYPGDFDLLYARALMAEAAGRIDIVEADLRYILERDPDHADALNALGYTLADRTDRYKEAYEYIRRALELKPDNFAILDSMGWVLYRLGNHEEAIKYLRRSIELRHDHEVAAHLGEVLWVTGNTEEAVEVWKRALEEFPDEQMLRDVMRRFME
jgi:tetratricopeptide (TPR) repeat protein